MRNIALLSVLFLLSKFVNSQDLDNDKEKWRKLHFSIKTIDTHCDAPMKMSWYDIGVENDKGYVDLPRMQKGGLDGEFMAVFVPQGKLDSAGRDAAFKEANEMIDLIENQCEGHEKIVQIGRTADDFDKITSSGKICIFIGMENGYAIGLDINRLDYFYNRGVRYLTLCHFDDNDICDTSTDEHNFDDKGLSEFGIEVVKRMNELGMMVDVSHISQKSFFDVVKNSKKPVIASHSCVQGVKDDPRNFSDKQLIALKEIGGVIQINMVPDYLRKPVDVPEMKEEMGKVLSWLGSKGGIEKLNAEEKDYFTRETRRIKLKYPQGVGLVSEFVDHIDYVRNLIGIDYVGIGTDFEGGGCLGDCYTVLEIPNITIELFKRGYTKNEVEKIWSGNFLRVFKEVQRTDYEVNRDLNP